MYVWELVSCRLRGEGWDVWHTAGPVGAGEAAAYQVHLRRPDFSCVVNGPTLTEAYAQAARRAREHDLAAPPVYKAVSSPHFVRSRTPSRN
jgi:hypothetical protein